MSKTAMDQLQELQSAEGRLDEVVYELGAAEDWYYDTYDCSVEMLDVADGWLPTEEQRAALQAAGILKVYISYRDGSAVLVGTFANSKPGACSPRQASQSKRGMIAELMRERDAAEQRGHAAGKREGRAEAFEEAAKVAGRFETDWFDCNVPDWLAKRLGNIELAIRKLAEEAKRNGA